jgi:ABC-type multidrug transport system fused ATPase/permease subunit
MRSRSQALSLPAIGAATPRGDWGTIGRLLPYLWRYRWRVGLALAFMVGAKLSNVGVPLLLKNLIDSLDLKPGQPQALLVVPLGLLLAYGALRLSTSLFTELRELIFAKATEGTARSISLQVFRHLHDLSLRFHLERQTGGMTRDIERGTRAVHSLISYSLYSIVPTLIEVVLVLTLLGVKFDAWFAGITVAALVVYIGFTVVVTEWRTKFRKTLNELDSVAHSKAILQQRGLRGAPLRREPGEAAPRPAEVTDHAVAAQHRPAAHHRDGAGADAVAGHARRRGRSHEPGRPGHGQRLHDPALHPAELPRRHLPRDQAGADRHREAVRPARPRA